MARWLAEAPLKVAEPGTGGCSLPQYCPKLAAQSRYMDGLAWGSIPLGSLFRFRFRSSFLFSMGQPLASKVLPTRGETSGGAARARRSEGECHPGILGRNSDSLLPPPRSSEGEG